VNTNFRIDPNLVREIVAQEAVRRRSASWHFSELIEHPDPKVAETQKTP
jgi:hypothetical protein